MEAIVLAGGMGTRLRSALPDIPKPMAPVKGRPFLEYLLDYWCSEGVERFILCLGYKHEQIEEHFGGKYGKARMAYSVEEELLGTGGGLLRALTQLDSKHDFLALNGDTFFGVTLSDFRRQHIQKKSQGSVALTEIAGGDRYEAVELDGSNRILSFTGRDKEVSSRFVNGGVYLFHHDLFESLGVKRNEKVSLERDLFPRMLEAGKRLYGFPSAGRFIDIGTPEDYEAASRVLNESPRAE